MYNAKSQKEISKKPKGCRGLNMEGKTSSLVSRSIGTGDKSGGKDNLPEMFKVETHNITAEKESVGRDLSTKGSVKKKETSNLEGTTEMLNLHHPGVLLTSSISSLRQ